ncbi:MAG: HemK family modification methylase, partial [Pseudomonadota bacterium]
SHLQALVRLGEWLRAADYHFVTVTPETHRRVNERAERAQALRAQNLRDVFGWNWPFDAALLPPEALELLRAASALEETAAGLRARVRFSTAQNLLCVHSAFPTTQSDAVFFGPDTYRYCKLLARWTSAHPRTRAQRVVDIGCGSGAGALSLADRVDHLVLSDINATALAYATVNAALAQRPAEIVHSDVLQGVQGPVDLIIANPPYMSDPDARLYRDGGGAHGTDLSVRIVREGLSRLEQQRTGGTLILYTGAPIVAGRDVLYDALQPHLRACVGQVEYEELDPDVFGEELSTPGYANVERIAVIGLRVCLSS